MRLKSFNKEKEYKRLKKSNKGKAAYVTTLISFCAFAIVVAYVFSNSFAFKSNESFSFVDGEAHIEQILYLKEQILADNSVLNNTPDFSKISTDADTGLYLGTEDLADNNGNTYYFRGTKELLNNNVRFAGYIWKVLRINGDGSIRLFNYTTGTSGVFNNDTVNLSERAFYVHSDGTDSDAKALLETWYRNRLKVNYDNYIVDSIFCNDTNMTNATTFAADTRLRSYQPTLKCLNIADSYTKNIDKGNGKLSEKVGTITGDEISVAGGVYEKNGFTYFLFNESDIWTMTPSGYAESDNLVAIMAVYWDPYFTTLESHGGGFGNAGLIPVINLKSDVMITGGNGSEENPYVVK